MKTFLLIIELITGLSLILVILLHSPKGEGLGSMGGQTRAFTPQKGLETGLNKITYVLASTFFIVVTILGLFF